MAFVGGISFGSGGAYSAQAKLTGSENFAERCCSSDIVSGEVAPGSDYGIVANRRRLCMKRNLPIIRWL